MSSERAEAPLPQACPPQPLSSPERFLRAHCSETSSSNFPPPLVSRFLGCLLPLAYALCPPGPGGLSSPDPRELSTRAPPAWLPGWRPPARASVAQSIKAWPAWDSGRLRLAYILTRDPDSHCNRAKLLVTGSLWARAVPRHHRIPSQRASQKGSLKGLR